MLYAKLKFDDLRSAMEMRPGKALDYQGHKFAVESSEIEFISNGAIADIVGSEFLTAIEPIKVLAKLRETLAASNS